MKLSNLNTTLEANGNWMTRKTSDFPSVAMATCSTHFTKGYSVTRTFSNEMKNNFSPLGELLVTRKIVAALNLSSEFSFSINNFFRPVTNKKSVSNQPNFLTLGRQASHLAEGHTHSEPVGFTKSSSLYVAYKGTLRTPDGSTVKSFT